MNRRRVISRRRLQPFRKRTQSPLSANAGGRRAVQLGSFLVLALGVAALLGRLPPVAAARATGGPYTLRWATVGGGGSAASGGGYTLKAAGAQTSAAISSAGAYRLTTGFGAGALPPDYTIYLPVVVSQSSGLR